MRRQLRPPSRSGPAGWLDAEQRRHADQLISTFENSTTEISYDYAEDLGDGRGVTAGRAGFTTATCDAFAVIDVYTTAVPGNPLARFLPELDQLCRDSSDDTTGLPAAQYVAAWKQAARDAAFRAAQDEIVDRDYYRPAMTAADELGLRSAIARAQLFDTAIQHGPGDDPDGLPALIARTTAKVGLPSAAGEARWLAAFFDVRIADLRNPANRETAAAWRDSVDRVECMRRLVATGHVDLHGPMSFSVYGDDFTVE